MMHNINIIRKCTLYFTKTPSKSVSLHNHVIAQLFIEEEEKTPVSLLSLLFATCYYAVYAIIKC